MGTVGVGLAEMQGNADNRQSAYEDELLILGKTSRCLIANVRLSAGTKAEPCIMRRSECNKSTMMHSWLLSRSQRSYLAVCDCIRDRICIYVLIFAFLLHRHCYPCSVGQQGLRSEKTVSCTEIWPFFRQKRQKQAFIGRRNKRPSNCRCQMLLPELR